jgi:hypothetical protein
MVKVLLFVALVLMGVNSQVSTTCQITSYYGQLLKCPQPKDLSTSYTSQEISTVCSGCNALTGLMTSSTYCCPQGYTISGNSSGCSCGGSGGTSLECVNCGYTPTQSATVCQGSSSEFATINSHVWGCPNVWGNATQNVSGWECSCGSTGTPCFYCSTLTSPPSPDPSSRSSGALPTLISGWYVLLPFLLV